MELIVKVYEWIMLYKADILNIGAYIVAIASIIVKLIPTLDKDNRWLPFVKWLGTYLALDKGSVPDEDR